MSGMSAQTRLIRESMPSELNMPILNVPSMHKPILENFDAHVNNFINFLKNRVRCVLIYDGPDDVYQHILNRTLYACSVKHLPTGKIMKNVFPIMLGSRLDLAIRYVGCRVFDSFIGGSIENMPFQEMDLGRGFFIISGFLRHLPYSFTNDPSRTHHVFKKSMRVFTYDSFDRGKELSFYTHDATMGKKVGSVVIKSNKGTETTENVESFFDFCPYPTDSATYMSYLYTHEIFDIDSLTNKIVLSPGHLYVKLFVKCLYGLLQPEKICWSMVKAKAAKVTKCIETGKLMRVISQKTKFHKEGGTPGKSGPQESYREIGADGEVFVEKSAECYREVNSQTYPLNPFFAYIIVRQISSKVKANSMPSFHDSYAGFLCILGCYETKNVGRTTMMVRDTVVSACVDLDPVFNETNEHFWKVLNLETLQRSQYFVVVNEACIPVTKTCFENIDLLRIKHAFQHIECYKTNFFIHIHYKAGLILKKIPGTDVWVTPRDIMYWMNQLFHYTTMEEVVHHFKYPFITSYFVDMNPFFMYTAFPKDILAFNSLKNAVLATDGKCAQFFMDTVTVYSKQLTDYHKNVLDPLDDGVSPHFVCRVPHMMVSYMSFLGCTQEDCIVCREDVNVFDCYRMYAIRVKLETEALITFRPVEGDAIDSTLVGSLVHDGPVELESFSIHVKLIRVNDRVINLHFHKKPFRVIKHHLTSSTLSVCVEQEHRSNTGDKLCSFHGQKGVMRMQKHFPLLDERVTPDLLVNVYGFFRMTPGQIKEGIVRGQGRDATVVRNSDGKLLPNAKLFYGKTFYFPIAYWSSEHLYAPVKCTQDKISNQSVKGRSRLGGMRLGTMELNNGLRANGIASCFEEKFFEHGDRSKVEGTVSIPKVVELIQEDARIFKCNLSYTTSPSVVIHKDHSEP